MDAKKLKVLSVTEYNLIANKDPQGSYDRRTRENLYAVINKLEQSHTFLSRLETKLFKKFRYAKFSALEEKGKKVKLEVARYKISNKMKNTLKASALVLGTLIFGGFVTYKFFITEGMRTEIDLVYYEGLRELGWVSQEKVDSIQQHLAKTQKSLKKTKKEYKELVQMVDRLIKNNELTKNLKYIVKQIYNDPRTSYYNTESTIQLIYDGRKIGEYSQNPDLWYLVGILETGMLNIYYNNEHLMEIETIFGRKGEETPIGEYEIKNKIYKPTWYKKERVEGRVKVRVIPFGDPDHEIGYWWLGLKKLGAPIRGSYGIHGVNVSKSNEFVKKNFDWRNGSAGCPNIQAWYLDFLAHVLPEKVHVNIVPKDKWRKSS